MRSTTLLWFAALAVPSLVTCHAASTAQAPTEVPRTTGTLAPWDTVDATFEGCAGG